MNTGRKGVTRAKSRAAFFFLKKYFIFFLTLLLKRSIITSEQRKQHRRPQAWKGENMKNLEIFYTEEEAQKFANALTYEDAEPEIIHTYEPDDDHGTETECWAVYFNPPKMN